MNEKIDPHPQPLTAEQRFILDAIPCLLPDGLRTGEAFKPMPGPDPLTEVITWVPEREAVRVAGAERLLIVQGNGRRHHRCGMWHHAEREWVDSWTGAPILSRVLLVAEVKGVQA